MFNSVEIVNNGYRCKRCGKILQENEVNDHAWSNHYKEEVSDCMVRLNTYIDEVSSFFVSHRNLNVDSQDVAQFARIGIFELFEAGKFSPPKELTKSGDSVIDRFAKASCNLYLLKFMREYFYRKNHIHYRNREPLPGFKYSDVCLDTQDVYEENFDNSSSLNYDTNFSNLNIIDNSIDDPLSKMHTKQIKKIIRDNLNDQEYVLFSFITDREHDYTQPQIAKFMGVKQQTISIRIKKLRKKIKSILKNNYLL